ncbi:MAG: GNAT family N-acetyltransferase [Chloroflexi bacterium]|nr:GNAT family N-acetyltransferase [Chloroflexota bacterium]
MGSRPARDVDAGDVARTITLAFASDPVWGPALARVDGRPVELEPYWRLFVDGAVRFGTVRMTDDGSAVSVWLPPGASELSADQAVHFQALVRDLLDEPALVAVEDLFGRFEASRRGRPSHYYLSLLATHPDQRGKGIGQRLLAEDLALWDAEGVPAYLESTNPANDHRYERAGFRIDGGFGAVRTDAWINAMWRPAGGS